MQDTRDDFLAEARQLAEFHVESDPQTEHVFYDPTSPQSGEVRLVEVTADAGEGGDLFAFRYAANPELGHRFKVAVVLMHPNEWTVLAREQPVVPGWSSPSRLQSLFQRPHA